MFRSFILLHVWFFASLVGCKLQSSSKVEGLSAESNASNVALMLQGNIEEAVNDFKLLEKVIGDPQAGYNFRLERVENADMSGLTRAVAAAAAQVDENGTLLLFLGGHGSTSGGLALNDGSHVDYSEVKQAIVAGRQGLPPVRRLVMLIFACYSGSWIANMQQAGDVGGYALNGYSNVSPTLGGGTSVANNAETSQAYYRQRSFDLTQGIRVAFGTNTASRANDPFREVLIITSSTGNEQSWFQPGGYSNFMKAFATALDELWNERAARPTIRDLVARTERNNAKSTIAFAAQPDTLFQESLFNEPGTTPPLATSTATSTFTSQQTNSPDQQQLANPQSFEALIQMLQAL